MKQCAIDDLTPEKQENARKSFKEETERYYKQMRELERKEKSVEIYKNNE